MTSGEAGPIRQVPTQASRRALVAGCIGNLVEWYDFALYGAFASVIALSAGRAAATRPRRWSRGRRHARRAGWRSSGRGRSWR